VIEIEELAKMLDTLMKKSPEDIGYFGLNEH
jgi:hypothetical protein